MDTPMADKSMLAFRFLIREVLFDDDEDALEIDLSRYLAHDRKRRAWCYNVEDTLLWTLPELAANHSDIERFEYGKNFSIGDVVHILPQALKPNSPSIKGDYGVVVAEPVDKDTWLESSNAAEAWDARYTIQYIDVFGFLNEYRLPECCLASMNDALPKERTFLPIWARFIKGKARFPDGLADRIRARKVHLLDIPRYNVDREEKDCGKDVGKH